MPDNKVLILEPEENLSLLDLIVKSSMPLIIITPNDIEPTGFGSGCIIHYQEKLFLLSVAHVTDYDGESTCIITNQPPVDKKAAIYNVDAMCYFDEYKFDRDEKIDEIQSLDDLLKDFQETLDVTFCEIKESIQLIQLEADFGFHKTETGKKIIINFDCIANPENGKMYGFSGYIRQKVGKNKIESVLTLKIGLKFHRTKGRFHMFLADETIQDENDYRGCSGAPIIDEEGKLIGLAASVVKGTKIVFGFSIHECKRLLDLAIETKLLK